MEPITPAEATWVASVFGGMVDTINRAVVGMDEVVRLALTCLFSQGHLLLEEVTGSGKTTLARSLARCVYGSQARIQFTPDLEPSDITGVALFDKRTERYRLHPGPIFNSLIVADEINRATPRTQSALLEAMEEGRVTVQGITNTIGPPFMVIATQNPTEHEGTFPLPEAQLDRFMMSVHMGYPSYEDTLLLLNEASVRDRSSFITPILDPQTLQRVSTICAGVHTDEAILRYVLDLVEATRSVPGVRTGVSVRGGIYYMRAVKSWAASQGRSYAIPEDVQRLARPIMGHRIFIEKGAAAEGMTPEAAIDEVLATVAAPTAAAAG